MLVPSWPFLFRKHLLLKAVRDVVAFVGCAAQVSFSHHQDSALWVNPHLEHQLDGMEQISFALSYALRWRKHSETRWVDFGASCRMLATTLTVGVEALVRMASADPHVSQYDLHGFERCGEDVRRFVVVAAVATGMPECLLTFVLRDDRVLRQFNTMQGIIREGVRRARDLPMYVWERLSYIAPHCSPNYIRTTSIHAVVTSASFIHRKGVLPYTKPPFPCGPLPSPTAHRMFT